MQSARPEGQRARSPGQSEAAPWVKITQQRFRPARAKAYIIGVMNKSQAAVVVFLPSPNFAIATDTPSVRSEKSLKSPKNGLNGRFSGKIVIAGRA